MKNLTSVLTDSPPYPPLSSSAGEGDGEVFANLLPGFAKI
jgi:hypothetical protein